MNDTALNTVLHSQLVLALCHLLLGLAGAFIVRSLEHDKKISLGAWVLYIAAGLFTFCISIVMLPFWNRKL